MVLTSIKPDREILTAIPTFWTSQPTLGAYGRLFSETNFLTYFWNSIFVAGCATLLTIFVATLAAYGITRFRFRGRETIAGTMLFTYMFAPIMIVVPFYILMRGAGLTNSHLGLILAYTTFSLPFSMWMLRSFFQSIPLELEEAAMMDGASRPKAVRLIIVPLALPGVIAVSIFTFIVAWNDYLFARVLIGTDSLKTLPVGIQDLYEFDDHGLGNGDGGRRHDHHSGAALLPCGPALSHRRLGCWRRQGVSAFAHPGTSQTLLPPYRSVCCWGTNRPRLGVRNLPSATEGGADSADVGRRSELLTRNGSRHPMRTDPEADTLRTRTNSRARGPPPDPRRSP